MIDSQRLLSWLGLRSVRLFGAAATVLLGACSQTPVTVTLHALQASGNVSFLCYGVDGQNHLLSECPDYEDTTRKLFGLVTQTATNEVAVIDLQAGSVVDDDPSIPGYSFLRVGGRPGAIVSTPGGAASFVGVSGLQENGIFALPTGCLTAPRKNEPARDLTTWSACSLSSAPGDITVLVDAENSCQPSVTSTRDVTNAAACAADLSREPGPSGARKLLVALPDENKLVVLDAQAVLNGNPGEFGRCNIEHEYPLKGDLPASASQVLPPDLKTSNSCSPSQEQYPVLPPGTKPVPAGFALSGGNLYVADRALPLVHVLDVSKPCAGAEKPPLLPVSYLAPKRVVTTSRLAVSPLTPLGKQFVYAIDAGDQPAASVMVFDVSPGATDPTPLIFPGSPRQPFAPPDRIRFSASVRDVTFVMRDFPVPMASTGVGTFGLQCNPEPSDTTSPASQYRPVSDFSSGARPANLRGVFGFAMLTNGQVAIIDVEDFDAPCRRPESANPQPNEDFRGCSSDTVLVTDPAQLPALSTYFSINGAPTVTNESSCNVIEPHRARAATLSISNVTVGLDAPSLRGRPQFNNPDPAAVIPPAKQPHLLGVDFPNPNLGGAPIPAQVNISTDLYTNCHAPDGTVDANCTNDLGINPVASPPPGNSVVLPLVEPRSYPSSDSLSLTFEGRVMADRTSGFLSLVDASNNPLPAGTGVLKDGDANFCGAGVEPAAALAEVEANELGIPSAGQAAWSQAHADYVQITGDYLATTDVYWTIGHGNGQPATDADDVCTRDECVDIFGTIDDPTALSPERELSITEAHPGSLQVTPRHCDGDCGKVLKKIACCFPAGTAYTVRASHQWILSGSTALTDVASFANPAGGEQICRHSASCDARKAHFRTRAFELCDPSLPFDANVDTDGKCSLDNPNVGCLFTRNPNAPVEPGGEGSACIFENLTSRFAVYRGAQPSARDMSFTWQTTGGFTPQAMTLTTQSTSVNPQSMTYLPELGYMAVVDGSTLGLTLFNLDSLGVVLPSPYF